MVLLVVVVVVVLVGGRVAAATAAAEVVAALRVVADDEGTDGDICVFHLAFNPVNLLVAQHRYFPKSVRIRDAK